MTQTLLFPTSTQGNRRNNDNSAENEGLPVISKNTVKTKVLAILRGGGWLTLADIRDCFDRTEQGSQSCDRYLRFLRADGYTIEKRRREHGNCWEYKLV